MDEVGGGSRVEEEEEAMLGDRLKGVEAALRAADVVCSVRWNDERK